MDKRKIFYRIGAAFLALILFAGLVPTECITAAENITHGTADTVITEDMLSNEPPADYVINEAVQGKAKDKEYNRYFLEEDLQVVRLTIDENNLNYVLQNAIDEPYVMAESVTIGDVTLGYVGFKTKGSYTLEHAYTDNPGSDRFSFTIHFGKYIKKADYGKKQDFFGCNKISFNNFFFDKTMMKEFFALKLMDEMGLPTPRYGLAKLYINDEYYGVYAMIEAMDESILEQYYGVDDDELSSYLVKPEGTSFLYDSLADNMAPLWENDEGTKEDVSDMLPTVIEWVEKLNCLHEGKDFQGNTIDVNSDEYLELLGQIYDVEEVVKYFATHSWLCQMDNMFDGNKNFGLYIDKDGKAIILPWDYDLSFGCYYPSTAEATANFDVDVMWRNGLWGTTFSPESFYKDFPLFYVIFQNDSLMEKYYGYMKQCSQIAALGGTVNGKSYEPGYFHSYIEAMQEEIIAAASEKLADNVYYMNHINQPGDVKKGLPNLSKIIAMRAVGVCMQIEGVDTTVSGAGCNLETLGNAIAGESERRGNITIVDAKTGIFASAVYAGSNRQSPQLTVKLVDEVDTSYQKIIGTIGCDAKDLTLYSMKNKANPAGEYTLTIPVPQAGIDAGKTYSIYVCSADGNAKQAEVETDGNLYTIQTDDIRYIAVVEGGINMDTPLAAVAVILGAGALLAVGVAVILWKKKVLKSKFFSD